MNYLFSVIRLSPFHALTELGVDRKVLRSSSGLVIIKRLLTTRLGDCQPTGESSTMWDIKNTPKFFLS